MTAQGKLETPAASGTVLRRAHQEPTARRWQALHRFARHRLALVGVVYIFFVYVLVFPLASVVTTWHPHRSDMQAIAQPPGAQHPLGTDMIGRDVWSRLVYGGRVSMSVGLVATSLYITIGTAIGLVSGNFGGRVDSLLMRFTEVVMAFPAFVFLIALVAILGPGVFNSMIVIGLVGWTGVARLVRGQCLSLRERDFILAARALGVPERRIILRHIFPNVVAPLTVAASFGVAGAILTEAGLSFLGLGVKVPIPSWGNMISDAQSVTIIDSMPWLWIPAGLMISFSVLAINFIGDALRDALDPRASL